jgi:hypothetical protein
VIGLTSRIAGFVRLLEKELQKRNLLPTKPTTTTTATHAESGEAAPRHARAQCVDYPMIDGLVAIFHTEGGTQTEIHNANLLLRTMAGFVGMFGRLVGWYSFLFFVVVSFHFVSFFFVYLLLFIFLPFCLTKPVHPNNAAVLVIDAEPSTQAHASVVSLDRLKAYMRDGGYPLHLVHHGMYNVTGMVGMGGDVDEFNCLLL